MSGMDPRSDEYLRQLARDARLGALHPNKQAELDAAMKQSGPLSRELARIGKGEA